MDDACPMDQDANEELDPRGSEQGHYGTAMSGRDHSRETSKCRCQNEVEGVNLQLYDTCYADELLPIRRETNLQLNH